MLPASRVALSDDEADKLAEFLDSYAAFEFIGRSVGSAVRRLRRRRSGSDALCAPAPCPTVVPFVRLRCPR